MHLSRTSLQTAAKRPGRLAACLAFVSVLACAVAVTTTAAAVSAPAARLVVIPDEATPAKADHVFIDTSMSPRAPAPAKLVIYAPTGWGVATGGAAGSSVGPVSVSAFDQDSSFSTKYGFGDLTVGAASLGTDATAQACAPGPHNAVWVGTAKVGNQSLPLRFYVDQTSGTDASLGAYRITTCLPSPYLPPEQGGAPNGMQITDLALSPTMTNPAAAGTYGWRVLVTPYVPGTATGDTANTFEARTHVLFPFLLTLRAVYQSQMQRLVVSGRALALGKPLAGVSVGLFADWLTTPADEFSGVELKDATTRSDGTFSVSEPRKRMMEPNQSGKLEISAFADGVTGPCTDPSVAAGGCTSDTLSPPITPFPGVKVSIPALAKRH